MMKLRHLRYFVTVVDAGSFSRAATIIHIAQPAARQLVDLPQNGRRLAIKHLAGRLRQNIWAFIGWLSARR
ncbi:MULTISPECIES: LysR family transcriptional regulator [Mesorhizobium]|uniref:LysR family transcriptional regulator n=1 Tax=Mesorhizobium sp. TaxID=1871066 RepID=UPI000493E4E8|nr:MULTISPECIES: LysR family transcriptional regulator [Mesorhizobium]